MIIKSAKAALPGKEGFQEVDILIKGERIVKIGPNLSGSGQIIDASRLFCIPGGIDPHVHFDDPGYTHREDFYHGSCAAASGGITTVIDMPCTSIPPVVSLENLHKKRAVIEKEAVVDYGLYGGVSAQSLQEGFPRAMEELSREVLGFKTYFISGMESFSRLNHHQFRMVLEKAKALHLPVLLHAEDFDYVQPATDYHKSRGDGPLDYYRSRPEIAETAAVAAAVEIAEATGANLHIVHVSSAKSFDILSGSRVTGETAPHYLQFDIEDFEARGSPLKTTPPVKSPYNKRQLWQALSDGSISFVASDHAPCPEREKHTGSIWTDYAGIPGCGTLLPYLFSEGYMKKRISLQRLLEVTSMGAAKRYGLSGRKGSLEIGKDADIVLIDPEQSWIVRGERFLSKGRITPFEGMELKGKVVKTILRGTIIYTSEDGICVEPGHGRYLTP